jgi:hypothetical protein
MVSKSAYAEDSSDVEVHVDGMEKRWEVSTVSEDARRAVWDFREDERCFISWMKVTALITSWVAPCRCSDSSVALLEVRVARDDVMEVDRMEEKVDWRDFCHASYLRFTRFCTLA